MSVRLAALAALLAAPSAWACAVCGQGVGDQGGGAYLFMSIIMSLLPLAAIGSVAGWLWLRVRAHRREEAAAQAQARGAGQPASDGAAPLSAAAPGTARP